MRLSLLPKRIQVQLRQYPFRVHRSARIQKGFLSRLANLVLRDNNPAHPERKDSKLRKVDMEIVRDPYHSTFNYLWQMLRPALVESVGVSKKEQDAALKVAGFFTKVKRFFGLDKKKDKRKEIDTNNKEIESLKE